MNTPESKPNQPVALEQTAQAAIENEVTIAALRARVPPGVRVLMVDNYDSFTFNIVQYFGELGAQVTVLRNDEVTLEELAERFERGEFDRLCISPGPCSPNEAGVSVAAIRHFAG